MLLRLICLMRKIKKDKLRRFCYLLGFLRRFLYEARPQYHFSEVPQRIDSVHPSP
jgi:hypothetical protein